MFHCCNGIFMEIILLSSKQLSFNTVPYTKQVTLHCSLIFLSIVSEVWIWQSNIPSGVAIRPWHSIFGNRAAEVLFFDKSHRWFDPICLGLHHHCYWNDDDMSEIFARFNIKANPNDWTPHFRFTGIKLISRTGIKAGGHRAKLRENWHAKARTKCAVLLFSSVLDTFP